MKKLLFLVLLLSNFFGYAQYTLIPDVNFEKALIEKLIDTGIPDGKVLTANISGLNDLDVFGEGIIDFTGLENFVSLKTLLCGDNLFSSIDLSKNTSLEYLDCQQSKLTSLDVSKNLKLTNLVCEGSQLTNLDVSKNTALKYLNCGGLQSTNLDVSKNKVLVTLICRRSQLTSLDVSNNKSLLYIDCIYNNLINLNLKNGNNATMGGAGVLLQFNPNLNCIQVDDVAYSNANWPSRKDVSAIFSETCSITTPTTNAPPILTATGNSFYCPLTNTNIVSTISITDSDDTSTEAIYIQISSGYVSGQDLLNLNNVALHPTITSTWNSAEGKLTLKSSSSIPGTLVSYTDFENAIKDVQFSNSSTNPSGNRNFSISLVQANYLPRNGHYYFYIPSLGITWTAAKTAAENQVFYGLKGYLATLTAADESQLAGTQAPGAGWIGGTDSETEGVWKWATGPEAGTVFWNGLANGSTPNFALWNTGEPNQSGEEDYAHITAPGIGIPGSWNDLSNTGDASGNYQPKGYIVEYGGMPGDPILNLSASTSLTISSISSTTPASLCDSGIVILQATATSGSVNWYDSATGGILLFTGNTYVTPFLSTTKTYYAVANNCLSARIPIIATINTTPTITSTNNPATRCGAGTVTLQANSSNGIINWYADATSATIIATGTSVTLPNVTTNTTYYVQAINNGCTNGIRVPVSIIINPLPIVNDENVTLCQSSSVVLDAGVYGMLYNWSTGQTTQTIIVSASGIYTVDVTPSENCTSSKKITVSENLIPEIKTILVNETSVTIELVNSSANFEYSIDGVNFQPSNLFVNVPAGKQTAYVRDTSLCSLDQEEFIVVSPPLFFTPNKDNYHDTWEIGLINYPDAEVTIFDRYGKLIIKLDYNNTSWDGTYNNELLPASDYWYVLKLDKTASEKRGHFSLKR